MDQKKALQKMMDRYYFDPEERYPLLRFEPPTPREREKIERNMPQNIEQPGGGLIQRDQLPPKKVRPLQFLHLPRDPARNQTGIYDIRSKEDFIRYFENHFHDLQDGVYTYYKGAGRANGFSWFFLLKFENGEVEKFRMTSNGHPEASERSGRYYAIPYYIYLQNKD